MIIEYLDFLKSCITLSVLAGMLFTLIVLDIVIIGIIEKYLRRSRE